MNRFRNALLASLFVATIPAFAQADTAKTLTGTVTGSNHQPLAGAVVKLENQSNNSIVSFITDDAGHYSFKRISSKSNYQVWAAFKGARSKAKDVSSLDNTATPNVDLQVEAQ